MKGVGVPPLAYKALEDFLAKRGVELEGYQLHADQYGRYVKLIDEVIVEGIAAIKGFEEFDRHVTRMEEAKMRIEEAKRRNEEAKGRMDE